MILIFGKKEIGEGFFVLLPRAEFSEVEKAAGVPATFVSLARKGGEGCRYPLGNMDAHDFHAPPWQGDGTAHSGSTVPGMTVQQYRDRILADIVASNPMKADLVVEVKDIDLPTVAIPDGDEGDGPGPGPVGNEDGWNNNPILN